MNNDSAVTSPFISMAVKMAASFILGAAMGATAQAAETPQYDRTVVAYGDLNLDSQLGTKVLYARLRNGAEIVCSSFEGRDMFFKRLWQSCFDQAVAAAVVQVNRPGVTRLHNEAINRWQGAR